MLTRPKKIQAPPRLYAFGMCLGLVEDTTDNVMNLLWCYGGKMVEADNTGAPTPAAGEVLNTHVIPKMIQRVLVDNWEPAKALEECDKRIVEIYSRFNKA